MSINISIVPAAVTNFSVAQTYPNDTNTTVVDVTVYWNEVRFIIMELYSSFFISHQLHLVLLYKVILFIKTSLVLSLRYHLILQLVHTLYLTLQ